MTVELWSSEGSPGERGEVHSSFVRMVEVGGGPLERKRSVQTQHWRAKRHKTRLLF